ncbi:TPA: hypothetical protein DD425_03005 [Candidatus Saccharibacteria bacterium]|nr:hypothetical protein [Candidatus Saccharibacteria bacterium]|tara:strand:- start:727 stop:1740 length:1014 start_codon:yes stop_codon:yes gene_type:complete
MEYDYSALNRRPTKIEVENLENRYALSNAVSGGLAQLVLLIIGVIMIVLMVQVVSNAKTVEAAVIGGLVVGGFIAGIVGMFVAMRMHKRNLAKLLAFTDANKARLILNYRNPGYSGLIFDEGSSREISSAIVFPDGKELGNFKYVTGSGRNRSTRQWGYMRVPLVRRLPHMVLDAKANNILRSRFSNLPDALGGNVVVSLEGNFNDFFTLYVPKGYETDALYVFTPDVMAAIIDHGTMYDIEVVDDAVYFYAHNSHKLTSEAHIKKMLSIVQAISSELLAQSDYYADYRVENRTINRIDSAGRRLKSRIGIGTIIGTIILVLFYMAWEILPLFFSDN